MALFLSIALVSGMAFWTWLAFMAEALIDYGIYDDTLLLYWGHLAGIVLLVSLAALFFLRWRYQKIVDEVISLAIQDKYGFTAKDAEKTYLHATACILVPEAFGKGYYAAYLRALLIGLYAVFAVTLAYFHQLVAAALFSAGSVYIFSCLFFYSRNPAYNDRAEKTGFRKALTRAGLAQPSETDLALIAQGAREKLKEYALMLELRRVLQSPPRSRRPVKLDEQELLFLDLMWVRGVRKVRGQATDSLDGATPEKVMNIMRKVRERWAQEISGLDAGVRISAQMQGRTREETSRMIKVFEDEADISGDLRTSDWPTEQKHIELADGYKKSAEQGDAEAQFNLGLCYYEGMGVSLRRPEAVKWFLAAAKQGHVLAQFSLASLYLEGDGVEQDYDEAQKWFLKAAEQGNILAQFGLGSLYYEGRGVKKSLEESCFWLTLAASSGDGFFDNRRDEVSRLLSPQQISNVKRRAEDWKTVHQLRKIYDIPISEKNSPSPTNKLQATFVPRRRPEAAPAMPPKNVYDGYEVDFDIPLSNRARGILDYIDTQGYLCPLPETWYNLWLALPGKYNMANRWYPAEPPHPNTWEKTPDSEKRAILIQHLKWADQTQMLTKAEDFFRRVPPEKWAKATPIN